MGISFEEMLQLMNQCHDFASPLETSEKSSKSPRVSDTVFFGIVPGLNTLNITCLLESFATTRNDFDNCCLSMRKELQSESQEIS